MVTRPIDRAVMVCSLMLLLKGLEGNECQYKEDPNPCPMGYFETTAPRTCLRTLGVQATFDDAKEMCSNNSGHLAVPYRIQMRENIKEFTTKEDDMDFWVSLDKKILQTWFWKVRTKVKKDPNVPMDCDTFNLRTCQWKETSCDSEHRYYCEYKSKNKCRSGWLPYVENCVKAFTKRDTWLSASENCRERGTEMLAIDRVDKCQKLKDFDTRSRMYWLGFSDQKSEGAWQWLQGQNPFSTHWAKEEGFRNKSENCATADKAGRWYDRPCWSLADVVCQAESLNEPKELRMTIHYHYPPKVIFRGTLDVVCTALNAENDKISWDTDNVRTQLSFKINDTVETITTADGGCARKTTSTYSAVLGPQHNSMFLSCYAYKIRHKKPMVCTNPRAKYAFCDDSGALFIQDREPFARPVLNVSYLGKPGPAEENTKVTVSCSLAAGNDTVFIHAWVIYFPKGPEVVSYEEDRIENYRDGDIKVSKIEFEILRPLSGISLACFAYDVLKYRPSLLCEEKDRYCNMTEKIIVKKVVKPKPVDGYKGYMGLLLFLPLPLMLVLWLLMRRRKDGRLTGGPVPEWTPAPKDKPSLAERTASKTSNTAP